MEHHDDRSPLVMKIALRQALRRLREERETLSQYEVLAANLGWEEVSASAAAAGEALSRAAEVLEDAVEAAVRLQAERAHEHPHLHDHPHTHTHTHPHEHQHGG